MIQNDERLRAGPPEAFSKSASRSARSRKDGATEPYGSQSSSDRDELLREFERAAPSARSIARLRKLGVPDKVLFGLRSHVGVARIEAARDGLYQPAPDGFGALLVPVGIEAEPTGWRAIDDLVAFRSGAPDRWWRRRNAAVLLGESNVARARLVGETLTLHPDPLSWLRGGMHGAVVVDWDLLRPWAEFADIPRIVSPAWIGVRLKRLFAAQAATPPELVAFGVGVAA